MPDRELATTRIALLELGEERRTAREGYALLDEKRMLLATRALSLADTLAARRRAWHAAWASAVQALGDALDRHGVQALEAWPAGERQVEFELTERRMLGVPLPAVVPAPEPRRDRVVAQPGAEAARDDGAASRDSGTSPPFQPSDPSPEVAACAGAWRGLLTRAAELAALETALWRLADEYRRTERRTAAIEHVLLPELEHAIVTIEQALESGDQEEAIRVRHAARTHRERRAPS